MIARVLLGGTGIALLLSGAVGCSIELWGGNGNGGQIRPGDPGTTTTESSDEGSPEADLRGWYYELTGARESFVRLNCWTGYFDSVRVIPFGGGTDLDFVFEWDWIGTYNPERSVSARESWISNRVHCCENNSLVLTIEASDGTSVQRQPINHLRSDAACDMFCDGDIDNCPFTEDGFVPPDDSCLTTEAGPDFGIPQEGLTPCLQSCVDQFWTCYGDSDCDPTTASNVCLPAYQSCITNC